MKIEIKDHTTDEFDNLYPVCGHEELQYFMSEDSQSIKINCLKCPECIQHKVSDLSTDQMRDIAFTFIPGFKPFNETKGEA